MTPVAHVWGHPRGVVLSTKISADGYVQTERYLCGEPTCVGYRDPMSVPPSDPPIGLPPMESPEPRTVLVLTLSPLAPHAD